MNYPLRLDLPGGPEVMAAVLSPSQMETIRRNSELTRLEQDVVEAAVAARLCADEISERTLAWYASDECTESYADARNRETRLHTAFEKALDRLISARAE